MIDAAEAARAFDAAFAARARAGLSVRPETAADAPFLRALFLANFPLSDVLPATMVAQQADFQLAAFRGNYPDALRRIVTDADGPVGRIIVDWQDVASRCADIAVLPTHGRRGVGTALLGAWIEAAAAQGLACTLDVQEDNPARALYARLGFTEDPQPPGEMTITMRRPAGPATA
jgi:ribosomal protein S18 acetylase RimI-like enzyme